MKAIDALNRLTNRMFPPHPETSAEDLDYLKCIADALKSQAEREATQESTKAWNRDLIPVNNGEFIQVFQYYNGDIIVKWLREDGSERTWQSITAADFVTMLNWYRYQKDNGNANLTF